MKKGYLFMDIRRYVSSTFGSVVPVMTMFGRKLSAWAGARLSDARRELSLSKEDVERSRKGKPSEKAACGS